MLNRNKVPEGGSDVSEGTTRRVRADARRNIDSLLDAAKSVFADSGVDAPVREIAAKAGVGVGTVYRHFPQRSDLVVAVFQHEVDATAAAARELAAAHEPGEALALWLRHFAGFFATKRGLAAALHSGDPAFGALPAYFDAHLRSALESLLAAAVAAGHIRANVDPNDLLYAIANLAAGEAPHPGYTQRMVDLLVDGLRYGAPTST